MLIFVKRLNSLTLRSSFRDKDKKYKDIQTTRFQVSYWQTINNVDNKMVHFV